jgi:uncharacterized membrane protein (DUF2068 family)
MCGTPVAADARFCPNCGRDLRPVTPQASVPPQPVTPIWPISPELGGREIAARPTGVSALTAVLIIGGIINLVAGAFSLVLASVYLSWLGLLAGTGQQGLLLSLGSFVSFVAGVVSFILAYGLWKARGWAWTWTLISCIVGLVISIIAIAVGVGIIGIVIYAIIIYYLTRARVKAFFGKGSASARS